MINPRNIFIFLFLLGAFVVGYLGVLSEWNNIGDYNVRIAQAEARVNVARRDLEHSEKLVEFYSGLAEEERRRVIAALPKDTDLPNLLTHIDRIARESGVILSNFSIKKDGASGGFAANDGLSNIAPTSILSFQAKGGYTSAKEFLRSLEKFLRIVDIDTVLISSDSQSEREAPLLNVMVTSRTYEFEDSF